MHKRMATMSAAALLIFSLCSPVSAESVQELTADQQQIQKDRAEVTADLSKSEKEIVSLLEELDKKQDKLDRTAKALKLNEKQLTRTKKSISNSEKKVDKLGSEIDGLEQQITQRYSILKERLAAYQKSGGDIGYLEVLAEAQSFSQFASRAKAVSTISNSDYDLMKELEAAQDELSAKQKTVEQELASQKEEQAELEGVRKTIADQNKQLAKNKKALEKKRLELKEKQTALKIKDEELVTLQKQVGERIKEKKEEEKRKAQEEAERKAAEEAKRLAEEKLAAKREIQKQQNEEKAQNPNTSSASSTTVTRHEENEGSLNKKDVKKEESNQPAKASSSWNSEPAQAGAMAKAIEAGYTQIGTPYVWGGKKPGGFDCSGFVAWAYRQAGYDLPSSTAGLQYVGKKIPYSGAQAGDMVFFNTYKTNGHVGIYLGDGRFLGAQDSGLDVADMNSGYWKDHFSGHVRRIQ